MYTSNELLSELSTTELVQLKDGVDLEVARLDSLARDHLKDDSLEIAKQYIVWRDQKTELAWKLSVIIEARLEEAKGDRAIAILESILAPYIPTVEEN